MAGFCAHVLLFNEQLWADKRSVYRGKSAASKVCNARARMSSRSKKQSRRLAGDGLHAFLNSLFRCFFQHALLELFLALDAMTRPGHRFQTLGIDLFAAVDTFPEA